MIARPARTATLIAAVAVATATPVRGQERVDRFSDRAGSPELMATAAPSARMVGGGLIGGAGGLIGGTLLGAALCRDDRGDEFACLWPLLAGAAAGYTLGMPIGVHLGNDRQGSLPLDAAASIATAAATIGFASLTSGGLRTVVGWSIPIVMLFAVIEVEEQTSE